MLFCITIYFQLENLVPEIIRMYFMCLCRKVLREAASGSREAERVKLKLEIKVEVRWVYCLQHLCLGVNN